MRMWLPRMSTGAAAEYGEFNPVIAAALTVVGIFSFISYLVFAALAPDVSGQDDGRANALSRSAVGFAALGEFLQANGIPVLVNRGLPAAEIAKASLAIITPSIGDTKEDILAVSAAEPKLIVLPKWIVAPDPQHSGWVSKIGIDSVQSVSHLLSALSAGSSIQRESNSGTVRLNSFTTGKIEQLQTISGGDWIGYALDARQQHAVVSRLTGTEIYALSDPDLLNTRGLKDIDTARTAIAIIQSIRANNGPVILDVTLNGYRHSPNFLRLLLEPPFLGATLCALIAALLIGANAAVRFGAPARAERVFAFGKSALIDNSSALIAMDHREARMIRRYAVVVRREVARAIGVATGEDDEKLNTTLDQLRPKQASGPALSEIFAEAGKARTVSDAMSVARKLHRWRGEMIHGA